MIYWLLCSYAPLTCVFDFVYGLGGITFGSQFCVQVSCAFRKKENLRVILIFDKSTWFYFLYTLHLLAFSLRGVDTTFLQEALPLRRHWLQVAGQELCRSLGGARALWERSLECDGGQEGRGNRSLAAVLRMCSSSSLFAPASRCARGGNPQILRVHASLRDRVSRTSAPTGESQFEGLHCQARGRLACQHMRGSWGT